MSKSKYKSRGALSNPEVRYHEHQKEVVDDGWFQEEPEDKIKTELIVDHSKSVITENKSPDVPFDQSINPYRGCEHGCVYCFARPTHAYLGWSPGIEFETKILYKPNAAEILRKELCRKSYQCKPIAMGTNTDPYQQAERDQQITRQILEVCAEFNQPVSFVTKSALIERDLDILKPMAEKNLVEVIISVTTLDKNLSKRMEPRAAAPERRLRTIKNLSEAGIPTGVLVAPIIPFLNDDEFESILAACAGAGAQYAQYVLLRLPMEVKDLFEQWLQEHYPLKAERIMQRIKDSRGGKAYDSEFGERITGTGKYAQLIKQRFSLAVKKHKLNKQMSSLDCSLFLKSAGDKQMSLF